MQIAISAQTRLSVWKKSLQAASAELGEDCRTLGQGLCTAFDEARGVARRFLKCSLRGDLHHGP